VVHQPAVQALEAWDPKSDPPLEHIRLPLS
jgi:hypothetical protein